MIRRIIDSVSLLVESEFEEKASSKMDSFCQSIQNVQIYDHKESSSTLLSECNSSDVSPSNELVNKDKSNRITDNMLDYMTTSASCYIQPKPVIPNPSPNASDEEEKEEHEDEDGDNSLPRPSTVRQHSRSPDAPCDLSSFGTRKLPGGPSLNHHRKQRVLNARKKETHKCHNNTKPCLTAAPLNRQKEEAKIETVCDAFTDGTAFQTDPLAIEVECYILPFVRDLTELEIKLPSRFQHKFYRRILKELAAEYELLVLTVGKGHLDQQLVVRKRASFQQKQQIQWEEEQKRKLEQKLARQLAEEKEKEMEILKQNEAKPAQPTKHEMCCQVEFDEQGREVGRKRFKRIRKNREAKRQLARKKPQKVDTEMQTVPEDYWLCPWCVDHIPPEAQCGHEAMCRAGVQQKQLESELKNRLNERNRKAEIRRLQRLGLPQSKIDREIKKQFGTEVQSKASTYSARSRSRNRATNGDKSNKSRNDSSRPGSPRSSSQNNRKQNTVITKLDNVHPNDLEAMAKLMQRLCSEPKCNVLADSDHPATRTGIKCQKCKRIYCATHRPLGKHAACSAPLNQDDNETSVACGWDPEEKKAALKLAMRERKAQLRELRMRN